MSPSPPHLTEVMTCGGGGGDGGGGGGGGGGRGNMESEREGGCEAKARGLSCCTAGSLVC
jgi:hypothetical protein